MTERIRQLGPNPLKGSRNGQEKDEGLESGAVDDDIGFRGRKLEARE
jgi:hypothetical protein